MHTLSSTLRPSTQHAVRAKVVLLANDPLHTPHIRQRQGLTEHKKRGITPHRDHWNGGGVEGSVCVGGGGNGLHADHSEETQTTV